MYIYVPHMKSLVTIIQKEPLYTYFTYITEQIWWPHSKYSSHSKHATWAHISNIFAYIYDKTQLTTTYTLHVVAEYVPETNMPQSWA